MPAAVLKALRPGKLTDMVMISERPPRSRTEPSPATGRAIFYRQPPERRRDRDPGRAPTRYLQLVALPDGTEAERVADALAKSVTTLPAQLALAHLGSGPRDVEHRASGGVASRSTSRSPKPLAAGLNENTNAPPILPAATARESPRSASTRSPTSSTAGREDARLPHSSPRCSPSSSTAARPPER